ncbi:MAG: hypothetical protein RSE58_08720 [Clostridia bacterium]
MKKKKWIIIALMLCVLTSLTAGTLAVYTSTVEVETGDISAKAFAIDAKTAANDSMALKLAPLESTVYKFYVTNKRDGAIGEVDTKFSINAEYKTGQSRMDGFRMTLVEYTDDTYTTLKNSKLAERFDTRVAREQGFTWNADGYLKGGEEQTRYFGVVIKWDEYDSSLKNAASMNEQKTNGTDGKMAWDYINGHWKKNIGHINIRVVGTQVV